jgi:hypothetical protein
MNNQIASTEIRALDDAELDMIAGGSLFGNIVHGVEHVASSVVNTVVNTVVAPIGNAEGRQPLATPAVGMIFGNLPSLFLRSIFHF